jgi:hypothetical protein
MQSTKIIADSLAQLKMVGGTGQSGEKARDKALRC